MDWKEVENFLSTRKNMEEIPMDYVARKQDAPMTIEELSPDMSPHDMRTKTFALSGTVYIGRRQRNCVYSDQNVGSQVSCLVVHLTV